MNLSSILGILAALAVFFISIFTATPSRGIFLDPHGILIVIGGTIAASLISFKLPVFVTIFKLFFNKFLGRDAQKFDSAIKEIVELSKNNRENPSYLKDNSSSIKNPFLREAIEMMVRGGMSAEELDTILMKRAATHLKRYEEEAMIFKTIGKCPPAFGLMGTTLGMIALMQNMGSPDSYKTLGPSMAIGLVATLYGIAITNLILIPMGENLSKLSKEDEIMRDMVIDGVQLIRDKVHPLIVEEHLLSYLLPNERAKITRNAA